MEKPETFGQHINAEISSQILMSNLLINCIISLSPRKSVKGQASKEDKVAMIIKDLMEKLPEEINMEEVLEKVKPQEDQNPLKVVLL